MLASVATTPYNGINKMEPSVSFPLGLALFFQVTTTPSYGLLNPSSFIYHETASGSAQILDNPRIYSSSATNLSIYTDAKNLESFDEANINSVDEDLIDWDMWIENPPVVKSITINARFVKGSYIRPPIDKDMED